MNDVNVDTIIEWMKSQVENKIPVAPSVWLDAAAKLNVLSLDLSEELIDAEMDVNRLTNDALKSGKTATSSRIEVRATDAYAKFLKLKAKKENVTEFIRLAKKRTELDHWDQ